MEDLARLFGGLLAFIYHCFDRVVILGHLPLLTRPENIVHFFRDVHGVRAITKEVLRQRTIEYSQWVEAFTRKHQIPIEWAAKGVRKEDSSPLAADGAAQPRRRISSSRAWRSAPASARPCRSIPPPIRTTASSAGSARVTPITTSTSATPSWDRSRCASAPSCPFRSPTTSTAITSSNANCALREWHFAKMITPSGGSPTPAALQRAADALSAKLIRARLEYWTFLVGPKFSNKDYVNSFSSADAMLASLRLPARLLIRNRDQN